MARGPLLVLRLEGIVGSAAVVALFAATGAPWWWFAALFFLPDLGMLGTLAGPRAGSFTYNLAHTSALPVALGVAAWTPGSMAVVAVALAWMGHVAFDRALGDGLKHATSFHDTHLGRIGWQASQGGPG